jgi:hypothetical protein
MVSDRPDSTMAGSGQKGATGMKTVGRRRVYGVKGRPKRSKIQRVRAIAPTEAESQKMMLLMRPMVARVYGAGFLDLNSAGRFSARSRGN